MNALKPRVDTLERAVALQGAYMAVLQRVLVRLVAAVALAGHGDDVSAALREGAEQLSREMTKLRAAGYDEILDEFVGRFVRLRDELAASVDARRPVGPDAGNPDEAQ